MQNCAELEFRAKAMNLPFQESAAAGFVNKMGTHRTHELDAYR